MTIVYFVPASKKTLAERLVRLFRNYVWKLCRLSKSIISDEELQFVVLLMKYYKLNSKTSEIVTSYLS